MKLIAKFDIICYNENNRKNCKKGEKQLLTIQNYVVAENLEHAYTLNQNKRNCVLGGMHWLKMSNKAINCAIDLGKLDLDYINETEDSFEIGCMTSLRSLELHNGIDRCFDGAIRKSLKKIVGIQLRNTATVGATIFSRFGFSDLLTCLLALDTYVELYNGGTIPLNEFVQMKRDRDILVKVIIKKDNRKVSFQDMRLTATDFSVLNCAVSRVDNKYRVVVGARPGLPVVIDEIDNIDKLASYADVKLIFGTNLRGSSQYRQKLSEVLIERAINEISGGSYED